jgi:cytochrome c oxidase subunit 3
MEATQLTHMAVDSQAVETAHAEAHPDLRVFGLITFLFSEGMLFLGLFTAYFAFRAIALEWPPAGTEKLEILLPGINTIILVSSSFVIHQADHAIKENKIRAVQLWFLATFVMGAIFIAGQLYEYQHLGFGLTTNIFASTFYVLTGFHGLHVIIGLCLILAVLLRSFKLGHYTAQNHFGIAAASIYWHFVDIIWIVLFSILYIF